MSEVRQLGRPFTPGNAPRTGGVAGRKNKISARSLKVIDALLTDFAQHGSRGRQDHADRKASRIRADRNGRGLEDGCGRARRQRTRADFNQSFFRRRADGNNRRRER